MTDVQRQQLRLIYSAALGLSTMATDVIEMARRGDQLVDGEPVRFQGPPGDQRLGLPIALGRVLLNLVTNALKFTESGSVEITARVSGPGKVEFSVADTGRGISEEALATLYQPFRRSSGDRKSVV